VPLCSSRYSSRGCAVRSRTTGSNFTGVRV
jgi:hypothetical protein